MSGKIKNTSIFVYKRILYSHMDMGIPIVGFMYVYLRTLYNNNYELWLTVIKLLYNIILWGLMINEYLIVIFRSFEKYDTSILDILQCISKIHKFINILYILHTYCIGNVLVVPAIVKVSRNAILISIVTE